MLYGRPDASVHDRPRAYGLNYWAVNLGAAIAPVLGGFIAAQSYRALFAADATTSVIYGVVVWAALPETRPAESADDAPARGVLCAVLSDHVFLAVCLLSLAFSIVFFQSFVGLPIDVRAHGISPAGFGGLIALNGVLIVLLQPFAGELMRDSSRPLVLAGASLLLGVGFGMNAWIGSAVAADPQLTRSAMATGLAVAMGFFMLSRLPPRESSTS